jgi:RNA polymerase sigma factor (sigma-70 family)
LDAFEVELAGLLPRLRRFGRVLARDAADADDLVQTALERALKARAQWMPGTQLDSWMLRIMRNCWIDETRSRTRRARSQAPEEDGLDVGDPAIAHDPQHP